MYCLNVGTTAVYLVAFRRTRSSVSRIRSLRFTFSCLDTRSSRFLSDGVPLKVSISVLVFFVVCVFKFSALR